MSLRGRCNPSPSLTPGPPVRKSGSVTGLIFFTYLLTYLHMHGFLRARQPPAAGPRLTDQVGRPVAGLIFFTYLHMHGFVRARQPSAHVIRQVSRMTWADGCPRHSAGESSTSSDPAERVRREPARDVTRVPKDLRDRVPARTEIQLRAF